MQEEFDDTKGVIRIRKSKKDRQHNGQAKMTKGQTTKDLEVLTTSGKYPWSSVTQIFRNSQPSHGVDRNTFEVMTST